MVEFTFHTAESAPEGSRARLEKAQNDLGFIPGLWAVQAEAPASLEGYQTLACIFDQTSLSPTERQVVMMAANFEHECTFCMAAHSWISKAQGVPDDVVASLRDDTPLPETKQEALRVFTRKVIAGRGWVSEADTQAFLDAGYTRQQILEVILGVSLKVISNYTNHFARTPVNEAFSAYAWTKPARVAAE